jgi:hypothetical protein
LSSSADEDLPYQVQSVLWYVLLPLVEGEQEGAPPLVVHPAIINCVPLIVAVAGDDFSELGAHKDQRALDVLVVQHV